MTLLLSCQNISKSFGSRLLFKEISLGIFRGDKIGLIGPNGSGKSTFLKILAGLETVEEGLVAGNRFLKVGYVPQDSIFSNQTIEGVLLDALQTDHMLSEQDKQTQVSIMLSKMGFADASVLASSLSGGWKKRLDIAKELIKSPDLLLLDEPTNHLDLEGVLWLEKLLKGASFSYIVISHDRYFLENVTTRMMELNRSYPKGMFSVEGSYSYFLEKKEEFLKGQVQQERSLASKVRREVEWLRQTPQARTTKSQSRVQEAQELIEELSHLKSRNKSVRNQIEFSSTERQTRKFLTATNIAKSMGGRLLFQHLNLTLSPGLRLGIVGLNGSGKTTLLKILAGELPPDQGTIKYADDISIVYFDQHRAQLPSHISLREALAPDGESINYRGKNIHVNAWCKRFLFSPDRLDLPFGQLSGGEKARVHIARLMLKPADILLLDEPTNDLDIPTLEILEESLLDFPGALVLISHDRYLLDQVSNLILGLGASNDNYLFADYAQWETFQSQQAKEVEKPRETPKKEQSASRLENKSKKFTYSEKREWEMMEGKILSLEQEIEQLQSQIHDPALAGQTTKLQELCQELGSKQHLLEKLFERWAELESKQS
jgi:ABC transport system ATP-binding/permease protein